MEKQMKNFRELQESLNRPYKWKVARSSKVRTPDGEIMHDTWIAVFTTDDGSKYKFSASLPDTDWPDDNWEVMFSLESSGFSNETGLTGTAGTSAIRVLATIKDIFEAFVKKFKPITMEFSSDKEDAGERGARTRLYSRFSKKFAKDYGYKLKTTDGASVVTFSFTKKKKATKK